MEETLKLVRIVSGNRIQEIDIAELAGKTLRQIFQDFSDQYVLAKVETGKKQYYFCGNQQILQVKLKAGAKAVCFDEAISILEQRNSPLLDEICLPAVGAETVFAGATLLEFDLEKNLLG